MNIHHIEYIYGKNNVSVKQLVDSGEVTLGESYVYGKMYGIQQVRRSFALSHDLYLRQLIDKLIQSDQVVLSDVKYIMLSHTADLISPVGPNIFGAIIDDFGFVNARYFSTSAYNCASIFCHLMLCHEIFDSLGDADKIILLSCDVAYTKILKTIPGATLMSDAALAVIMGRHGVSHQYITSAVLSCGEFSKGVFADSSNQMEFQSRYLEYLADVILSVVKKSSLSLSEIKLIFPHNVNVTSWSQLSHMIDFPIANIYMENISLNAHAFGADPFINLKDAEAGGLLKKGDYYLLVSVGLGAAFAAAVFQY